MSCGIKVDVDELLKNVKDDHVVRGEIVNGNTLRLHRKEGGTVDVVLPASEDHDTKISSFDLANRGGKNVLEITQTDGSKFTAYLPETTPPAADKYVTAFDISTQGNTTNLTITRSDNEQFTVQLPQAQGGGGADIYVNKVEVDYRIENETEVHPFLVITRNDGQKFEVELPSGGAGGPDVHLKTLTTDAPPSENMLMSDGDGYYFSKNVPIEATLTDNTKVKTMQPWNRLYWTDYQPFAPFDTENAREVRPVVEVTIVKGRLKLVRDDATATYLDLPNAGGGGGAGGSDKYTRSLNAEMDVDDTRIVGDVEYRRPTLYANLSDGTNISTKLPFEVAFNKKNGEQLFPGASGAGDGAIKDVKPSTAKNRTIVVTDSSGNTKELTLPDNWFNGKDGKDGKDADSIKGQFITHETFDQYLNNQILMQQWSAPLEWGLFIGNLPSYQPPNDPLYAKFKVARSLPAPVIVGEGSNERAYTRSLSLEVRKAMYATWKGILLGYDAIKPLDKFDIVNTRFKDQTEERTWHASIPYKIMTVANPLRGSPNNFLYKPMLMYAFNTRGPGLYAMDVYEEWDNATEATGGVSSDQFMYYRGTIYTNTGPHGDGYFPCLISTDGVNWSEMVARIRRTTFIHIREVTDPTEKASVTADQKFKPTDYGIGRGNHDYD